MDQIRIQDMEIYAYHGVLREEHLLGQKFLVSLVIYLNTEEAGRRDDLASSINYADVAHFVEDQMKEKSYKLLETLAQRMAQDILIHYPLIKKISIEIKKPWAPILIPMEHVGIRIERGWTRAYLSAGSNMGDKNQYIENAVAALRADRMIRNVAETARRETKPYGYENQDDFLNSVISLDTMYSPEELLKRIHQIEGAGKRERTVKWGPRTIDLDILLFGNEIVQTDQLVIPHKEMHLRGFVLDALKDIAPWSVHPVFNRTIYELWRERKGRNS